MTRIVLGVTGSVAAIRTPALYQALAADGRRVRVLATEPSLHFFDQGELPKAPAEDDRASSLPPRVLIRNADEWPGCRYQRDDPVLHIELRKWADLLVVAPLDAHTLARFALGLSDHALTCLFRAWDFAKPVILAPAMNTRMWQSPVTLRHLRQLLDDRGDGTHPARFSLEEAPSLFARHCPSIVLIPPQTKRLACGDVGVGAMAEVLTIAEAVRAWTEQLPDPSD
jgi:phosphopantothenoylcysteine decarboxylase